MIPEKIALIPTLGFLDIIPDVSAAFLLKSKLIVNISFEDKDLKFVAVLKAVLELQTWGDAMCYTDATPIACTVHTRSVTKLMGPKLDWLINNSNNFDL